MKQGVVTFGTLHFFSSYKWPLFALLFCCFAAAILGDSTAESLLLSHFAPQYIPTMFLVNAVFLFLISAFLMSLIDSVDRGLFFIIFAFGHGIVLVAIRACLLFNADFLYLPLFSYAYVTKILMFLMFWTLANDLVDSRRASSEFPFIAAGGTAGAIAVSFAIPVLLKVISPQNLLIAWAGIVIVLGFLFVPFRKRFGATFRPADGQKSRRTKSFAGIRDDMRLLAKEPLLKNMALFYFLLFFVLLNQHFTFYSQLKRHLADAKAIASFLGYFNGISMFATVGLQLGVSGIALKKIGSTRSMLFLPGILCAVFAVLCILVSVLGPSAGAESSFLFWAVTVGMGLRVAFFDSFFSPNFQVFFSSLPQEIRGRGKLTIEGVVKPASIVAASAWILWVAGRLPLAVNLVLLLLVSGAVVLQTFRIRSKYAASLTAYLSGFRSKKLPSLFNLVDVPNVENFLAMLGAILDKEEYEIKKFIISILAGMNARESVGLLVEHLGKADAVTRATIISTLAPLGRDDCKNVFVTFLDDSDRRVVATCVLALAEYKETSIQERLHAFLDDPDNRTRANAVVAVWKATSDATYRNVLSQILARMLESESSDDVSSALYAMGEIGAPDFMSVAREFIRKNGKRILAVPSIRNQLATALAKIHQEESFDLILSLSRGAHERALGDLCRAVRLLVERGYEPSGCLAHVSAADFVCRGVILKALVDGNVALNKQDCSLLETLAHAEAASIYSDWLSLCILDTKASLKAVSFFRTAIYESCILEKTSNLICIAALLDETGQIGSIMHRLRHPNRHVRARAFEVLDNAGNIHINRWLISLLDSDDAVKHGRDATISFKQRSKTLAQTVSEYLFGPHEWLRTCSLYASGALFESTGDARWKTMQSKSLEEEPRIFAESEIP